MDIIDQDFCNQEFSIKDCPSSKSRQNVETYQNFQVSTEFLIWGLKVNGNPLDTTLDLNQYLLTAKTNYLKMKRKVLGSNLH